MTDDNFMSGQVTSFLNQSMDDIPLFRAIHSTQVTDEQRIDLSLSELSLFKKEVDNKAVNTECKAKWLRLLNAVFSLLIVACSAVIIGLQAAGECINIPVIVLSSIIFLVEGSNKLFKLGQQGVLQKHGTIQLKRLSRQARTYMYSFYKYTADQLLTLIEQLRNQYDDIDATLYTNSIGGTARYGTGLDIEHGGDGFQIPPSLDINKRAVVSDERRDSSPHVHIHLDGKTPSPYISAPNLLQNSNPTTPVIASRNVTPNRHSTGMIHGSPPNTPIRIPLVPGAESINTDVPTIHIDSDDSDY